MRKRSKLLPCPVITRRNLPILLQLAIDCRFPDQCYIDLHLFLPVWEFSPNDLYFPDGSHRFTPRSMRQQVIMRNPSYFY